MQLYKKRDFSTLFSDSISFVRTNGRHFYNLYFRIMALPLLALLVAYFFFSRYYMGLNLSFATLSSGAINTQLIEQNIGLYLGVLAGFLLIALPVFMLNYTFTPIYILLYDKYGTDFSAKDMVATMRERKDKIIKFLFAMIGAGFIIGIVLIAISCILAVTIIGILALPLVLGLSLLGFQNAYMEYIFTDAQAFEAINFGFRLSLRHFWVSVGCATLYYLMVTVIIGVVTGIPYYIFIFSRMLTSSNLESSLIQSMGATVIFSTISAIIGVMSSPLYHINFSIIYTSSVGGEQHIENYSEIDQIGQ